MISYGIIFYTVQTLCYYQSPVPTTAVSVGVKHMF